LSDLFEEVEERIRSDRYRAAALKVLPWVLGLAAVALVAFFGWWGWTHYQQQQIAKASDQYAAGLEALGQGREPDAVKQFTDASKSQAKGYKSLALMQLAGIELANKRATPAVKFYDQAAAAGSDPVIADAARLRAAFILLDTAPPKDVEARLTPLLQDGRPYRMEAREALAFSKLMAGDTAGARSEFVIISSMLGAPEGARDRAKAAIGLIDSGSAKAVASTVRAAAALPPTAPAPAPPVQPQAPGPQ